MDKFNQILDYSLFTIHGHTLSVYNVFLLVSIFIGVKLSFWLLHKAIKKRLEKKNLSQEGRYVSLLQLIKYSLYVIALVLGLESVGVDIKILLLGSAGLLVGLGFGLQEIFRDVLSGIIILFEGNINVGDVVEIEGLVGTVKKINIRTCEVETRESIHIIVPNSKFVNDKITNWSHNNRKTRFTVSIGVKYGTDVELVKEVLLKCAQAHPAVSTNPNPIVKFEGFGSSSLDFELLFWSNRIWLSELLKSEVRFAIVKAFKENNIEIPFPQLDLHVKSDDTKQG